MNRTGSDDGLMDSDLDDENESSTDRECPLRLDPPLLGFLGDEIFFSEIFFFE